MSKFQAKFSKLDKYGKPVFIVYFNENETETNKLSELNDKLLEKYPDCKNPVYVSTHGYCAITLSNIKNIAFRPRNIYEISYNLKHKGLFINAHIIKSKLIEVAKEIDYGETIEI